MQEAVIMRLRLDSAAWSVLVLCAATTWPADRASAQQAAPPAETAPTLDQAPRVDYDSAPPYTAYERAWNRRFPAPYRKPFREEYYPYGRPYYARRSYGPAPYGTGYVWPAPYDYGTHVFDDGYTTGFHDGRRYQNWQTKAELGLNSYLKAMRQGSALFRGGDYAGSVRQFILAAKLNQGDAASRLHAVHAMTAVGQYTAAVPALRRAIQLQPKLVYLPLDIRSEYGSRPDFDQHLVQLDQAARQTEQDAGLWLLLGYYQFFSGRMTDARASLEQADRLAPGDKAVGALLEVARLSAPAPSQPPTPPADKIEVVPPSPSDRRT